MVTQLPILVVDDEVDIRSALSEILTDEGLEVSSAADGSIALEHLERSNQSHVILLDLHMPVMGGVELMQALRERDHFDRHRIIVVSASPTAGRVAFEQGATMFLAKPFPLDELLAAVTSLARVPEREVAGDPASGSP